VPWHASVSVVSAGCAGIDGAATIAVRARMREPVRNMARAPAGSIVSTYRTVTFVA
jgi:hypothetical protein